MDPELENGIIITLINPSPSNVPIVNLPTGETVLAGRDRKSDPFRPMRYGNQKQAEAKLQAIRPALEAEGKQGGVVKQDGRFLILVYDAPEVIEIDPGKPLDVDSLPSWFAAEAQKTEPASLPRLEGTAPSTIVFDMEGSDWTGPNRGGRDLHRQTASEVFNVPESEVTDDQRRAAKTINYFEAYGRPILRSDVREHIARTEGTLDAGEPKGEKEPTKNVDREFKTIYGSGPGHDRADVGTGNAYELTFTEPINCRVSSRESNFDPTPPYRQGPGKIFATVNGDHINPRNRHNQGSFAKHVIVSKPPSRRLSVPNEPADPFKAEILRRQRLRYKLTGGRMGD